jgi:hypothetical protein
VSVETRVKQEKGDHFDVMPCLYPNNNLVMVKMIGRHSLKPGGGAVYYDDEWHASL